MKVRAMINLIEEDGWYLDRTRGTTGNIAIIIKRV